MLPKSDDAPRVEKKKFKNVSCLTHDSICRLKTLCMGVLSLSSGVDVESRALSLNMPNGNAVVHCSVLKKTLGIRV